MCLCGMEDEGVCGMLVLGWEDEGGIVRTGYAPFSSHCPSTSIIKAHISSLTKTLTRNSNN